jgi:hypothetical protein
VRRDEIETAALCWGGRVECSSGCVERRSIIILESASQELKVDGARGCVGVVAVCIYED